MNASRKKILDNIKANKPSASIGLPDSNIPHVKYENKNEQFAKSLKSVGGNAVWLDNRSIDEYIKENYKDALVISSTCKEVSISTKDQYEVNDPHKLEDVDLAVIKGEFCVAENGAVWIKNYKNRHRALYFIAKKLVIVVRKDEIVDTMHEAYERVLFEQSGYGTFISGPSKTADIEQALVIGAHGPTDACVLFI